VLREALGRYLPDEIAERPKQPYRAPDSESFVQPGAPEYVRALLSPEAIARAGYFDPRAVRHLAAKCARPLGAVSAGDNMAFVAVLSTQLLHAQFVSPLI
jgi:asparagine synthase (glutamine-hydrolysing)